MFDVSGAVDGDFTPDKIALLNVRLKEACDRAMARAVEIARANHVFVNRTGELEGSISVVRATGDFSADNIEAGIEATAEYAAYVVAATGDDFIARAMEEAMRDFEREIDEALAAVFEL